MLLILFCLFVTGQCQEKTTLDICKCEMEERVVMCAAGGGSLFLTRGTPGCQNKALGLWVTGEAFVASCNVHDGGITDVFIQKSTLSCGDDPRPRPPAFPVDRDDDDANNDDDDNNDDDGDSDDDSDIGGSDDESDDFYYEDVTSNVNSTTTVTTTTTLRIIIQTTTFSLGNWWWIVSVGVAIGGACILVVIRVRFGRRHQPVQDASVSSTTMNHDQETIRLERVQRSPRRRRTTSMEPVTLFAVNEHLD